MPIDLDVDTGACGCDADPTGSHSAEMGRIQRQSERNERLDGRGGRQRGPNGRRRRNAEQFQRFEKPFPTGLQRRRCASRRHEMARPALRFSSGLQIGRGR